MRLIDAEKLILHLNDYALQESPSDNESTEERRMSEMVCRVIQNCIKAIEEQPTAYDVEKVVQCIHEYFVQKIDDCEEDIVPHELLEYNKAICEIVRKGGVE